MNFSQLVNIFPVDHESNENIMFVSYKNYCQNLIYELSYNKLDYSLLRFI
jgi:hypothetical protein